MKITKKLLIIGLLPIILLFIAEATSFYYLKKSNDSIKIFLNNVTERQGKLSTIHSLLGYGRGIHAFKNYVLRGNSEYLRTADITLSEALKKIEEYLQLRPLSLAEKNTLDTLKNTIALYHSQLQVITKLRNENKSIIEIDKTVRVDDTQAIQALKNLEKYFIELRSKEINQIDSNFQSLLRFIFICYFVIITLSYLLISKISFELSRSISKVINQSKRISHFNFKTENQTTNQSSTNDELEELEAKMKTMEVAIKETFTNLEKSNKELENFAYVATHDIKSPLKKVCSFVEIINQDIKDRKFNEIELYGQKVYTLINKMINNVDDLLNYAILTHKQFDFHEVDINNIINSTEEILSEEFAQSNCEVIRNKIPMLQGNEALLNTLFINLFKNSMKFKKSNTPLKLLITHELQENKCRIKYIDNGEGFEENELNALMKPFTQISLFPKVEGVGLSLASCKRILEQHNSELRIKSTKGEGSTYEFELPLYT
ncbi:ATP-binding protein [Bacteriovorax sp. Seq25_V]|uniref:sensor histidine kinase n=1 Tax=Bacteriovorax sp. Seq25_V TaxID=1201288 RepID=UPI000389F015|nr:ATP-binding protein [Bacteriovorax sp. Seq25_V]EQC47591.1 GHKL domain protein [Bacteriovorax sp. Seq25_V]